LKSQRTHEAGRLRKRVRERARPDADVLKLADLCVQLSRDVDRLNQDLRARRSRPYYGDPFV
jgi:hypothetical protein